MVAERVALEQRVQIAKGHVKGQHRVQGDKGRADPKRFQKRPKQSRPVHLT